MAFANRNDRNGQMLSLLTSAATFKTGAEDQLARRGAAANGGLERKASKFAEAPLSNRRRGPGLGWGKAFVLAAGRGATRSREGRCHRLD